MGNSINESTNESTAIVHSKKSNNPLYRVHLLNVALKIIRQCYKHVTSMKLYSVHKQWKWGSNEVLKWGETKRRNFQRLVRSVNYRKGK